MSSRVNITYSLKVEDLPAETGRLWRQIEEELGSLLSGSDSHLADNTFSLEALSQIEELRQQLGSIDHALGDLNNIIQGYMHYQTQPPQAPPSASPAIDELAAKIQEFRTPDLPE